MLSYFTSSRMEIGPLWDLVSVSIAWMNASVTEWLPCAFSFAGICWFLASFKPGLWYWFLYQMTIQARYFWRTWVFHLLTCWQLVNKVSSPLPFFLIDFFLFPQRWMTVEREIHSPKAILSFCTQCYSSIFSFILILEAFSSLHRESLPVLIH